MAFAGFQDATVNFIAGLSDNNSKAWFDAHRADYDDHYIGAAKDFIIALQAPLARLSNELVCEPKVNGSIFRINRDIRFSKDKTPYKDHLDLWFWQGQRKGAISGLFFRLTRDALILGAGAHGFDKDRLAKYRAAVSQPDMRQNLLGIESDLAKKGLPLEGSHYAKLPRGFTADEVETERLLKFNALHAAYHLSHPPSLSTPEFVDFCTEKWANAMPLHNWLVEMDR